MEQVDQSSGSSSATQWAEDQSIQTKQEPQQAQTL